MTYKLSDSASIEQPSAKQMAYLLATRTTLHFTYCIDKLSRLRYSPNCSGGTLPTESGV